MTQGGGWELPQVSGAPEVLSLGRGWWAQGEGISLPTPRSEKEWIRQQGVWHQGRDSGRHMDVPRVMREGSPEPFLNCGCWPRLQSPLPFRVISSFTAHTLQPVQKGGGGGAGAIPPSPCSWEEIVPDCSLAGEKLARASSRISGIPRWETVQSST